MINVQCTVPTLCVPTCKCPEMRMQYVAIYDAYIDVCK